MLPVLRVMFVSSLVQLLCLGGSGGVGGEEQRQ